MRYGSRSVWCVSGLPYYFQSHWCVSEWLTFLERERSCKRDLVIPASFHDGERFPSEARGKQWADFSDYTSTIPSFWKSELALAFENQRLKPFARDLALLIQSAPPYQDNFPIVEAKQDQVIDEGVIERIADT